MCKQALKNLLHLHPLFSIVSFTQKRDDKHEGEGGAVVEIKLKEKDQTSIHLDKVWTIVPGQGGFPTLVFMANLISM